jgi:hypothetical protein
VEQGMKVFTAVYKRIYRSLSEEFKKLYDLNAKYMNEAEYSEVVDMVVSREHFNTKTHNIYPGADPTAVSQTEKLLKAQGLMEIMPLVPGMLNPVEVINRVLEAQEQPNREALFMQEVLQSGLYNPPPDPKMQEMQMKSQMEQQKIQMQGAQTQQKMELEARGKEVEMQMEGQMHAQEMQHEMEMNTIRRAEAEHKQRIFEVESAAKAEQNIRHGEEQHQQQMRHGEEAGKAKVQQMKAQAKAKPQAKKPSKGK